MGLNYGAYAVRVSGQDCERGTFNHRNAVLYDQRSGARRASYAETPFLFVHCQACFACVCFASHWTIMR